MRVAYVCADPGVPVFGTKGNSVHVQEVIRALVAQGADVELFAARLGGSLPAGLERVDVHSLPALPKESEAQREKAALAANGALYAALHSAGPFDMVYERYSLWSFSGMRYASEQGIPGLLEVNAPLIEEQVLHRTLVHRQDAERVAHDVFGAASYLLAVSREVAAYLHGFPGARGRIEVVTNGVDTRRFSPGVAPILPATDGSFTVGFVGTLKPWHGLPALAEAFGLFHAKDQATRLLLVGDGPERVQMEEELRRRGALGATHFTGAVAPSDVPGYLTSMDVAVAPYPESDNFYFSPLKVYEYMAAGLPVVASRTGQLAELIHDGENGLLCPPGDIVALARALGRLRRDSALRASLGRLARQTVLERHTWAAVADRILSIAQAARAQSDNSVAKGA